MDNLNEEIDALLEFSLDEAPSRIGSLNVRDFLKFKSKQQLDREKAKEKETEPEAKAEKELFNDECNKFLNDPAVKEVIKNLEAQDTVKKHLADTLRNLSITLDATTLTVGAATAATGIGAVPAAAIVKGGGVVSAGSLVLSSALSMLNGDYSDAAVDAAGAVLSAMLAGGGAASKGGKTVFAKLFAKGTAASAKVEATMVAKLVEGGLSEAVAKQIAKTATTSAKNYVSSEMSKAFKDMPIKKRGETEQDYKNRLLAWQKKTNQEAKERFQKCYKPSEDTKNIENLKKAIDSFDSTVNSLARKINKYIDLGTQMLKGGSLNESQIKLLAEEFDLKHKDLLNEETRPTDELVSIVIDLEELKSNKLNESFLSMFGGWVEHLLGAMFGVRSPSVSVRGSRRDVESFAKTIGSEKSYIEAAKRYGLDHPTTYKNKAKLDASIKGFERDTGLKWPFK